MGNCCSTCARPREKKRKKNSSTPQNASVRNSSSSFPSESDLYKRHDSMARYVEDSCECLQKSGAWPSQDGLDEAGFSGDGFVNTNVRLMLERNEARMDIQRRREKLEKEKQQKQHRNGHEGRKLKKSSIDDEYSSNVLESHPSYSGVIPRLKKKDSTRKPRYKDAIMLTDNIDSIVEREIPDEEDLKAEAASSSSGAARNNGFTLPQYADESAGASCSSGAFSSWRRKEEPMRTVNIIDGEVECDDSVSVPLDVYSVSVPACITKNLKPMDEEDMRVAKQIKDMLKHDPFKEDASKEIMPPTSGPAQLPKEEDTTGVQRMTLTIIEEEVTDVDSTVAITASVADTVTPEVDEELTDEADSISDDDIPIERSNKPRFHAKPLLVGNGLEEDRVLIEELREGSPYGAASPQVDNDLDKDFDNSLTSDILTKDSKKTSSGTVSPRVDHDSVMDGDGLNDDILEESDGSCSGSEFQTLENLFIAAIQKRESTINTKKIDDNELASDIDYIFSEDFSDESNEAISSTAVVLPRPKLDCATVAEEDCVSTPQQEDEDLENDIECILLTVPDASDERIQSNTASHPNKGQRLAKDTVNILQLHIHGDSNETMPPTPNAILRSKRNYSTSPTQTLDEEKAVMDVNTMVNDEIPTTAKLNWYGAFQRPKTRNPKRDLTMNMDEKSVSGPRRRPSALGQQSDDIQKSSREIAAKRPVPLNSGTGARPKTNFTRKPKRPDEIEMDRAFSKNSETPEFNRRSLVGIPSNHDSKVTGAKLSSMGRGSTLTSMKKATAVNLSSISESKQLAAQPCVDTGGSPFELLRAKDSSSSVVAQNCDSSSSIVIGDALRPMAARSSKVNCTESYRDEVKHLTASLQDAKVPRPPSTPKRKTKRPVIFVRNAPDTRLLGVASRNSGPGYDSEELKLMREVKEGCDTGHQRITGNRKVAMDDRKSSSCVQSNSFGPVYDAEDLKLMAEIEMETNETNAEEKRAGAHRLSGEAVTDSSPSMAPYREAAGTATDKYSQACAQKWSPGFETRHQRITCNQKTAVPSVGRHSLSCDQSGSKLVYDEEDQQLMREVKEGCDTGHQRITGNRKVAMDDRKSSSCVQSNSFGPVYDAEDLKRMAEIEMETNEPNAEEKRAGAHRLSDEAVTDSSPSMASYREAAGTATDKYSHTCAQKWSPGIVYTSAERDLMDEIVDEYGHH